MWESDTIIADILRPIFVGGSPFQRLSAHISCDDANDKKMLEAGFNRLFGCEDAYGARSVVFIWALDRPYVINLRAKPERSTILNIEKTDATIAGRWPRSRIKRYLMVNRDDPLPSTIPVDWNTLADHDANLDFYSRIIASFGPLRVWWSNVDQMNHASGRDFSRPVTWERLLIDAYVLRYGCRPLKNRN